MQRTTLVLATFVVVLSMADFAAAQWGTISGKVVFTGKVPKPKLVPLPKTDAFVADLKIFDESMIVGKMGGLKNVVVYMYNKAKEVHPSYAAKAKIPVVLNTVGCRYEPHITLLQCNQKLLIKNLDPVGHNTAIHALANPQIGALIPGGGPNERKMSVPEPLPCSVTSSIFPWMKGFAVIKDHPYMAVTDAEGKFKIEHLPVGEVTLQFWHEKVGYFRSVKVDGMPQEWRRGRTNFIVPDGKTLEIGEIDATKLFEDK